MKSDTKKANPTKVDFNAIENDSLYNNIGDSDEITNEFMLNHEELPALDNLTISEILEPNTEPSNSTKSKINIISNIQIRPPNQIINKPSDSETVHSSSENPIFGIPISERPINMYKNQIIITDGDILNIHIKPRTYIRKHTNLYNYFKN